MQARPVGSLNVQTPSALPSTSQRSNDWRRMKAGECPSVQRIIRRASA